MLAGVRQERLRLVAGKFRACKLPEPGPRSADRPRRRHHPGRDWHGAVFGPCLEPHQPHCQWPRRNGPGRGRGGAGETESSAEEQRKTSVGPGSLKLGLGPVAMVLCSAAGTTDPAASRCTSRFAAAASALLRPGTARSRGKSLFFYPAGRRWPSSTRGGRRRRCCC